MKRYPKLSTVVLAAALIALAVFLRYHVFMPIMLDLPQHSTSRVEGASNESSSSILSESPTAPSSSSPIGTAAAADRVSSTCEKSRTELWSVRDVLGNDPTEFCAKFNETARSPSKLPKIIYAIMFGVEVEMLEIVLHEVYPIVDQIFLTESTSTHSLRPKELLWGRIKDGANFINFSDKITPLIFSPRKRYGSGWDVERRQRSLFMHSLSKLSSLTTDDIVIGNADLDELFSRTLLVRFKHCNVANLHFNAFQFRYNLNCLQEPIYTTYYSTVFQWPADASTLRSIDLYRRRTYRKNFKFEPEQLDSLLGKGMTVWHMTAFGGVDAVLKKYENSPHRFVGDHSRKDIEKDIRMCRFNDVPGVPVATPTGANLPHLITNNMCYFAASGWLRN